MSATRMASRKRRSIWTEKDEEALITKWEEHAYALRRAKRNAHIYKDIAVKMAGKYSAEEVHIKIKNLTQKYREEKGKIDPLGGSTSTWRHFSAVHRIVSSTAMHTGPTIESFSMNSSQLLSPSPYSQPSSSPTIKASLSPIIPIDEVPGPSSPLSPLSPIETGLTSPLAAVTGPSVSATRKRKRNGAIEAIMKQQTKLLESVIEDTKALTNQIVSAVEQNHSASERIIFLIEKLIDKI
ncbi:uncharacterized protein LOC128855336 [Anastrepha ludens]|uniref:uncharacterized protein LOC128855336 n=1 Tax=Anastrepha ludens TaxID=28586 RepID=UPI0023B1EA3D|nr:uncharacterized protein LOC128855336 [Anastrepha ludens]